MTDTLDGTVLSLENIDPTTQGCAVREDLTVSRKLIVRAAEVGEKTYGDTMLLGGMVDVHGTRERRIDAHKIALWQWNTMAGRPVSAMLAATAESGFGSQCPDRAVL